MPGAGLGFLGFDLDGFVGEVDFCPIEAFKLGGAKTGEEAKGDVGEHQAVFVLLGGG